MGLGSLWINRGTTALQGEGITVPPLPLTAFPAKILQPDSYLKEVWQGKITAPDYQIIEGDDY